MVNIMNLINSSITAASTWFVRIFNASGVVEIYISIIFIIFAIRFVIVPIFGKSRGSDRARSSEEVTDE